MKHERLLLVLLGSGILLRILYLVWWHPPENFVYADMAAYRHTAVLQAQGVADPQMTLWHGLLTHILSIVVRVFGDPQPFVWLQLTASCVTLLGVCYLARRHLTPKAAMIATALQAFDPLQLNFSGFYMGETLGATFLVLFLVALSRWQERNSLLPLCLAGFFLGLAGLSREYLLLCGLAVALWFFLSKGGLSQRVASTATVALVCVLTIAPHVYRNYLWADQLSLGTTRSARYLAYAWSPSYVQFSLPEGKGWSSSIYDISHPIHPRGSVQIELHPADSLQSDYWRKVWTEELARHPEMLLYKLQHPILSWLLPAWPTLDEKGVSGAVFQAAHYLYFLIIWPFFLLQLPRGLRKGSTEIRLWNLIALSSFLMGYLGHGQASYRTPFLPVFFLLTAWYGSQIENWKKTVAKMVGIAALSALICGLVAQPAGWVLRRPVLRQIPSLSSEENGTVLKMGGKLAARAEKKPESELLPLLGPPVTEWNSEGFVEAWHYNFGAQRLRADLDENGNIERFLVVPNSSNRYFPPDELMRSSDRIGPVHPSDPQGP